VPGVHPNTIGIALGYGRTPKLGKVVEGVGQNVFPFSSFNGSNVVFSVNNVTVERTGETSDIAQIQTHNIYTTISGGRKDVMRSLH
jgi:molybdopterin-containing oxidoreductase family iron-sulfur binding subunit